MFLYLYDNYDVALRSTFFGCHGARTQKHLVALQAPTKVGAHPFACGIRISFDDGIDDLAVFLLQVKVIVLWARARCRALQFAAGNDA